MRMDTTSQSAAEWLAVADGQQMHEVIKNYGEEQFSRQIAPRHRGATRNGTHRYNRQAGAAHGEKTSLLAGADKTRRPGRSNR